MSVESLPSISQKNGQRQTKLNSALAQYREISAAIQKGAAQVMGSQKDALSGLVSHTHSEKTPPRHKSTSVAYRHTASDGDSDRPSQLRAGRVHSRSQGPNSADGGSGSAPRLLPRLDAIANDSMAMRTGMTPTPPGLGSPSRAGPRSKLIFNHAASPSCVSSHDRDDAMSENQLEIDRKSRNSQFRAKRQSKLHFASAPAHIQLSRIGGAGGGVSSSAPLMQSVAPLQDHLDASSTEESDGDRSSGGHGQSMRNFAPFKSQSSKRQIRADEAENDMIDIAARMGMVRTRNDVILPSTAGTRFTTSFKIRANSSKGQICPMGVKLKVLTKFAESIPDHLTTEEVVNDYIIPKTIADKSRLIDQVPDAMKDTPDVFVIHSAQGNFQDMVSSINLLLPALKLNGDNDVVWLDIFSINQHVKLDLADLLTLSEIQASTQKSLFMIDRMGTVFKRTWVAYELWQVSVSVTDGAESKLVVMPTSPWSWADLQIPFLMWDIGQSQASNPKETKLLLDELRLRGHGDLHEMATKFKDLLVSSARFEVLRSDRLGILNPYHFISSRSTLAMFLYLEGHYHEADDVVRKIMAMLEKESGSAKSIFGPLEEQYGLLHQCQIMVAKGIYPDADTLLQKYVHEYANTVDELYMEGVSMLVEVLIIRKVYTKAEMLCRKLALMREERFGKRHGSAIQSLLQMAAISMAQKLYDEAMGHLEEGLSLMVFFYSKPHELEAACHHNMAACCYFSKRHDTKTDDGKGYLNSAFVIRRKRLGEAHPDTLETNLLQAEVMSREGNLEGAETLLQHVLKQQTRVLGSYHHATVSTQGALSDTLRELDRVEDAEKIEKKLMHTGHFLLRGRRQECIDSYLPLQFIATFVTLPSREHLMEQGIMFLVKAWVIYKDKLGSEHELCALTRGQLFSMVEREMVQAKAAIENAELFDNMDKFKTAEVMFRQSWAMSKLLSPETEFKTLAQGLVDALFGQGKAQEAKTVMRSAGLAKLGMKDKIPASYQRWLNKRVASYLDAVGDKDKHPDDTDSNSESEL